MAFEWIKWVKGLVNRPEVGAIADRLDMDPRTVAACCMLVWEWADGCTTEGHIRNAGIKTIDRVAGTDGFALALDAVGWLRIHADGGVTFPRWGRHNGESAKQRALNSKRQKRLRHEASVAHVSRKKRHVLRTRPEERRKEKASGFGLNGGKGGAGGKVSAADITDSNLHDPDWLRKRYSAYVKAGTFPDCERNLFAFFGAAARAVRLGDDPPAMFRFEVEKNQFGHVSDEDLQAGKAILDSRDNGNGALATREAFRRSKEAG